VVAFLYGPSRGSVFTVREVIRAGKPAAVVLAGGGAELPVFPGGRWLPCRLGSVEAFRWEQDTKAPERSRRSWLARVFQVPDGEPTHALLEHIASLSPGERLWFERGVLVGDTVVVAHEALSDTPAFLHTRRLMRRFGCTVHEAVDLAELFLALDASPAVVAHYEGEGRRVGVAKIIEDLVHLVAGVALVEQVPDTDALQDVQSLGDAVDSLHDDGHIARSAVQSDGEDGGGAMLDVQWHALGTVHTETYDLLQCVMHSTTPTRTHPIFRPAQPAVHGTRGKHGRVGASAGSSAPSTAAQISRHSARSANGSTPSSCQQSRPGWPGCTTTCARSALSRP
jgi:hypothetical protein